MRMVCFLGIKAQKIKITCLNQYFLLIDFKHALKLSNIYIRYQIKVILVNSPRDNIVISDYFISVESFT